MSNSLIDQYINKRYDRWLDYAKYHAALQGMEDESRDILNEVLLSVLQKDDKSLMDMYEKRKGGYSELDFFILRLIKLNATSMTSPYRSKYKNFQRDYNIECKSISTNVEYENVEACLKLSIDFIEDTDEGYDKAAITLNRMNAIRLIFDNIKLDPWDKGVFEYRFFHGYSFSVFELKDHKSLYRSYNYVVYVIDRVLQYLDVIPFTFEGLGHLLPNFLTKSGDVIALDFVKTADRNIIKQLKTKNYG